MKNTLVEIDALGFDDARIEMNSDPIVQEFTIRFEGAYDAVHRIFVDGVLRVRGWRSWRVVTWDDEQQVRSEPHIVESESPPLLERLVRTDFVGEVLTLIGFSEEGPWVWWTIDTFEDIDLTIHRRSIFDEDEHVHVDVEALEHRPISGLGRVFLLTSSGLGLATEYRYLERCLEDSLGRNEAPLPLASGWAHYESVYEGEDGLELIGRWMQVADALLIYADLGLSDRTREIIYRASWEKGVQVVYRRLFEPSGAQRFLAGSCDSSEDFEG